MGEQALTISRWLRGAAPAWCALAPLVFGAVALSASRTKSATMDEPLHAVGSYLHVFHRDWRINPEDPPLWNYWAMLPHTRASLRVNFDDPDWARSLLSTDYQTRVTTRTLYQTPDNDGIRFVQRTRALMTLLGVALGWLIAWWAWKLAGPVAAAIAVLLYALDPNFLAHAPLVKNDVAISLLLLAAAMALWGVTRRATWWNVVRLGLLCGAALATKFSGVIIVPLLLFVLGLRAVVRQPWPVLRWDLRHPWSKLVAAAGTLLGCTVLSLLVIWASYGFRYQPTAAASQRLDLAFQIKAAVQNEFFMQHGRFANEREYPSLPRPLPVRWAAAADRHGLLPHAYVYGFVYTYQTSLVRSAYLMGSVSRTGWWYYFPLAMLFKTPLATIAAFAAALAVVAASIKKVSGTIFWPPNPLENEAKKRFLTPFSQDFENRWGVLCLTVPVGLYGISAMTSNLNLGLRHLLPVYPFLYLLCAVALARARQCSRKLFRPLAVVLALALAVETFASYPHFIPFFNAAFKQHRVKLLSDSNLDWGQDLPLLGEWRRRNPHVRLYLCYFGSADPAAYGIDDYVNLPPGFWLGPAYQFPSPSSPGVVAISATYLQGNHMQEELRRHYAPLRELRPREVLGGSIYLYDYPPR